MKVILLSPRLTDAGDELAAISPTPTTSTLLPVSPEDALEVSNALLGVNCPVSRISELKRVETK